MSLFVSQAHSIANVEIQQTKENEKKLQCIEDLEKIIKQQMSELDTFKKEYTKKGLSLAENKALNEKLPPLIASVALEFLVIEKLVES